jgi:hypothetical protein
VQCWGALGAADGGAALVQNASGQPLSGVVQVSAAAEHACAILDDGTVDCWGTSGLFAPSFSSPSATEVQNVAHAVTLVTSDWKRNAADGDCALQADGRVACWGGAKVIGGWGDDPIGCPFCGPGI